jgi:hypothetical protein
MVVVKPNAPLAHILISKRLQKIIAQAAIRNQE